jgi:hypothetical protein
VASIRNAYTSTNAFEIAKSLEEQGLGGGDEILRMLEEAKGEREREGRLGVAPVLER